MDVNEALLDEIADRFQKVLVGEMSRWDAHVWAEAMVFGPNAERMAGPVESGLQALHGLTMVETTPGRMAHLEHPGPLREWKMSDAQAHARFAEFTRDAELWRESPERYLDEVAGSRLDRARLIAEIDEIEHSMPDEDGEK